VKRPGPKRQRGSGWLEFGAVALLLAVLATMLLDVVGRYQEYAEKTAVELTVRNLRTAVRWQVAERLMQGRTGELPRMTGANPVPWLESPPPGYLGEQASGPRGPVPPGSWYFDTGARELVYVPTQASYLAVEPNGEKSLRWQVRSLKSQATPDDVGMLNGLVLVETRAYRWF
jgi:general secretion pathway protein G